MNSRDKGKRGELAWRDKLIEQGYEARRGQQHAGGGDSPDVVHNVPGVHYEVKWVEALNHHDAMDQARRDAPPGHMAFVAFRRNTPKTGPRGVTCRGEWFIMMSAEDQFTLLKAAGYV